MKPSRSEFFQIRGLRYHVRRWGAQGAAEAPVILLLHGWMDVSASFQFLVDCLPDEWQFIAPDWRGFGLTHSDADTFWFADYLADLDAILRHYCPQQKPVLCGHSMGGNVAMVYAGVRPTQVRAVVNLEGFGLPTAQVDEAPGRYARWLDQLMSPPALRSYANPDAVAARLQKNNARLSAERAAFLARRWAAQVAEGKWEILGSPAHKIANPLLYRVDEIMACWRAIQAPVLWVESEHGHLQHWPGDAAAIRVEIDRRIAFVPRVTQATIAEAGHMLHHDQPQAVAEAMERFLR
jgi:pimeloyl-ACP methyl ester carboxylesterase